MQTHIASKNPRAIIESLARRPEQPASMRQYQEGYEDYFNMLPVLKPNDPHLQLKTEFSGRVIQNLAKKLVGFPEWEQRAIWANTMPADNEFTRVILGVEEPEYEERDQSLAGLIAGINAWGTKKLQAALDRVNKRTIVNEGAELLVALWGKDFSSPVHGHAPGLLHEEILYGKLYVHTYKLRGLRGIAIPVRSDIVGAGTLVSKYNPPDPRGPRAGLVHNFTALANSASLHYVAEHTRDGRDNQYEVRYYEDYIHLDRGDVRQITGEEGRRLPIGSVCLVRSANVPEYGDHFIVITGAPRLKAHGLRPDDVAIHAPHTAKLLDTYFPLQMGLILLKLEDDVAESFRQYHDIQLENGKVTFPEA